MPTVLDMGMDVSARKRNQGANVQDRRLGPLAHGEVIAVRGRTRRVAEGWVAPRGVDR